MKRAHKTMVQAIEQAVVAGDAPLALTRIELLARRLERDGLSADSRPPMESALQHLRRLAEDSARGTQRAIDQVRDILATTRTLQTYNSAGHRCHTATVAEPPQRF